MSSPSFGDAQFNEDGVNIRNTSIRVPLILVIDRSGSMAVSGDIHSVNDAMTRVETFFQDPNTDEKVRVAVEVAIVSFGGNVLTHDLGVGGTATTSADSRAFVEARQFRAPVFVAEGLTPMGDAMRTAMRIADDRSRAIGAMGYPRKRPIIWLMSDGEATDNDWRTAASEAIDWQKKGKGFVRVLASGDEAQMQSTRNALREFTTVDSQVPKLKDANFSGLIEFVTRMVSEQAIEANGGPAAPSANTEVMNYLDFS
jgi:uncharacterized protein YegL